MKKVLLYLSTLFFVVTAVTRGQIISVSSVAKVGQAVTFNVTVDGTSPFTYQWRKDGVNITGATANNYILSNVTTAAGGDYTVYISNAFGNTISNTAQLKILTAPVFATQPTGVSIFIGNTLTLASVATGTPAPTYQWFKDNTLIPGATSATYTVTNAAIANSGTYKVVATSTLDGVTSSTTSANATVTVSGKPPSVVSITITVN